MEERGKFSSKLGFVMAAAGSAVGLGNIWRFPYLAANYGGGLFLLIYLFFVVVFGYSIMAMEISIGRKTGRSPIGAFTQLGKKYKFIGVLAALIAFLILPYYSVIGGWVLKYTVGYFTGEHAEMAVNNDTASYFGDFTSKVGEPIIFQVVFVLATTGIILFGVKKGVEQFSKILMPILVALSIGLAIYAITLPNAGDGLKYYLIPDFSKFSWEGVLAALGQMFYSMSLAMGIMITYGSYLDKKEDIGKSVSQIEWFDTGVAFLAGLMIIPAVFAFDKDKLTSGPKLMFVILPEVFENTKAATMIGLLFFVLVLFAALTSAISLMEAVVATVCDEFKWERKKATIIITVATIVIGIPSSLGFGVWSHIKPFGMDDILTFFDTVTNSLMMPICAILTCVFVAYILKMEPIVEEIKSTSRFKREKIFRVVIKYLAPIGIFGVLVTKIMEII